MISLDLASWLPWLDDTDAQLARLLTVDGLGESDRAEIVEGRRLLREGHELVTRALATTDPTAAEEIATHAAGTIEAGRQRVLPILERIRERRETESTGLRPSAQPPAEDAPQLPRTSDTTGRGEAH